MVFWSAPGRTTSVPVLCIRVELTPGMVPVLLLNRDFRGQGLVRGLFFIPLPASPLSMSLMWNSILHIRFGVVKTVIRWAGFDAVPFLSTPGLALNPVALITIRQRLPFASPSQHGCFPVPLQPSLSFCCFGNSGCLIPTPGLPCSMSTSK